MIRIRTFQALMVMTMAALLASASATAAPMLLGPGTYSIGPESTDHDGTIRDRTKFTTDQILNLSVDLHAELNPPPQAHRPFIELVILHVDPGGSGKTELYKQILTATGDITVDLPGLLAGLAPSGPNAYYVIKVIAKLAHEGGSFSGNFSLTPVPIPAAAWLFGTALIGLGAFARRRAAQAA